MKICARLVAAAFSLGLLVTASASAGEPRIAREGRFGALESKWMDALADKNVAVLEQLLADEFTIIGAGSSIEDPIATRKQWLAVGLERPFPRHAVRVLSVHELKGAAVVHAILTAEYPPMPWIPEGGTLNFLVTDTWVYRDGRWQVVARHSSLPAKSGAP